MRSYCLLILLVVLASCRTATYKTLVEVDNSITSAPDSAYTLLKSVDPNQLRGAKEYAYYALLFTQAQYKNYDTIKHDSLINIAVDYYTEHPDGDKLTRAFMYKGAVLNEMGLPRAAIDWYKKAEVVCDTSDYLTLGLLNTRMGELYQTTFIANNEDIEKYKKALNYYRKINHKQFENYTLSVIGQLYRLENKDSAYRYLDRSIELAKERDDSTAIFHAVSMLAVTYYLDDDYIKAKNISLWILNNQKNVEISYEAQKCLINSYSILGNVDSAQYYATNFAEPKRPTSKVGYFSAMKELALAKHDYKDAYKYLDQAMELADSIMNEGVKHDIFAVEKQFDNQVALAKAAQFKSQVTIRNYLIIIAILIIIIVIAVAWLLWSRKKRILQQQTDYINQISSEFEFQRSAVESNVNKIAELNETLSHKEEIETKFRTLLNDRVGIMKKLMLASYQYANKPEKLVKKFNELLLFNSDHTQATSSILEITNALYNNIIDKIRASHPQLTERELLLFSLLCLEFPASAISIFMGYSNYNSANVSRCKVLKKLGITTSVTEFLARNAD